MEWLIKKWGMERMRALLADLARGVEINAALAARFAPIEKLDADFSTHARGLANATGPKLDWSKPEPAALRSEPKLTEWIAKNPDNFTALTEQAKQLLGDKQWEAAKAPLKKLIALYPDQHDSGSAYAMLSRVHRELGESAGEEAMLNKIAELCSDAWDDGATALAAGDVRLEPGSVMGREPNATLVSLTGASFRCRLQLFFDIVEQEVSA